MLKTFAIMKTALQQPLLKMSKFRDQSHSFIEQP